MCYSRVGNTRVHYLQSSVRKGQECNASRSKDRRTTSAHREGIDCFGRVRRRQQVVVGGLQFGRTAASICFGTAQRVHRVIQSLWSAVKIALDCRIKQRSAARSEQAVSPRSKPSQAIQKLIISPCTPTTLFNKQLERVSIPKPSTRRCSQVTHPTSAKISKSLQS